MWKRWIAVAALVAAAACSGPESDAPIGGDDDDDDGTTPCPRELAPENRIRYGAVSFPYDANADPSNRYQVIEVDMDGDVVPVQGATFEMGRTSFGEIVFTPDGEVGLVAQEDGTLGVFVLDGEGSPTVVEAAFQGSFYAGRVIMDPAGDKAWILDQNWPKNGGGLYRVSIACDGTITDDGLIAASKNAYDFEWRGSDAIVYAKELGDSAAGDDLHRFALAGSSLTGGVDAFTADDDAIVADIAITADGSYVLIADNNAFGTGNRISVVDLVPADPTYVQTLTAIDDPVSLAVSPFDDLAIVSSGFGDGVLVLDYDSGTVPPFSLRGELTYSGAAPQLPGVFAPIARGSLEGHVFLAELSGVRLVVFHGGGAVSDHGLVLDFGGGTENIVGALGIPQ